MSAYKLPLRVEFVDSMKVVIVDADGYRLIEPVDKLGWGDIGDEMVRAVNREAQLAEALDQIGQLARFRSLKEPGMNFELMKAAGLPTERLKKILDLVGRVKG